MEIKSDSFINRTDSEIAGIDLTRDDIKNSLLSINVGIDKTIDEEMKRLLDGGFIPEKDLKTLCYEVEARKIKGRGGIPNTLENFLRGATVDLEAFARGLSRAEKIRIIAEYGAREQMDEESDEFRAKLSRAGKVKEERKKIYVARAKEVIERYRRIIKNNQEYIEKIKAEVEKKEKHIEELEKKLQEIITHPEAFKYVKTPGTDSKEKTANIDNTERIIKELNGEIIREKNECTTLKGELDAIEIKQAEYEAKLELRIEELRRVFEDKKLFFEDEQEVNLEDSEKVAESREGAEADISGRAEHAKPLDIAKPTLSKKKQAREIMDYFKDMSEEEIMPMLGQLGNRDLLEMSKNLGIINRIQLRRMLERSIEKLEEDEVNFGFENVVDANGNSRRTAINLAKKDLKNISRMDPKMLEKIEKYIREFYRDIDIKTPEEIKEFEDKLQYLRLGSLIQETRTSRPITRFFGRFTKKGEKLRALQQSMRYHSERKYKRAIVADEREDAFRELINMRSVDRDRLRVREGIKSRMTEGRDIDDI